MRRLVSMIFATVLLGSMISHSHAQERLNFAYISPNAGSSSVLWVAKDAGIFKKHGLDVNVIYIEGTPKALMSLFAGELQVVAGTGPAVASAKVRGADASMIMGFEVFLPYYLVATPAIKSVEDLKGKVGANHSAATSADFAMRLGLRNIGLDPERDVSLRVVGATNLTHDHHAARAGAVHGDQQHGTGRSRKIRIQSPGRSRQQKDSLPAQRPDQQSKIAAREARRHAALRARIGGGDSLF